MSRLVWVPKSGLEFLTPPTGFEVAAIPDEPLDDPRLDQVEVLVPPIPSTGDIPGMLRPLWQRMTSLRVVQTLSAGVEWILDEVPPGVTLCSARGAHDLAVSEWVIGAILAGLKDFAQARDDQSRGHWNQHTVGQLAQARVLLLGYGSIAAAVERRLEPFDVNILRVARRSRGGIETLRSLGTLLGQADVVVVLLPVTPQTRKLVDKGFLDSMRPGALLVNAARGVIVDTEALVDALRRHRIRAVLDVTDPEPLPSDHPLWHAPGVMITPHIAGVVENAQQRAYAVVYEQLERLAAGRQLENVVEGGY